MQTTQQDIKELLAIAKRKEKANKTHSLLVLLILSPFLIILGVVFISAMSALSSV